MGDGETLVVGLFWTYTPTDYFAEPVSVDGPGYTAAINGGEIRARIDPAAYQANGQIQVDLWRNIHARFLEEQIAVNKPFYLSSVRAVSLVGAPGTNLLNVTELGQRGSPAPRRLPQEIRPCDIRKTVGGKVVIDTARDRRERHRKIAGLAAKYAEEPVVKRIIASRQLACEHPDHELVHRYATLDALRRKFKSCKAAKRKVGISDDDWSDFEKLANGAPIHQGRHEGTKLQDLRDATDEEITKARKIDLDMFEAYLLYLEKQIGADLH